MGRSVQPNALTPVGQSANVSCMLTLCPSCNHALWLEVHSLGTFRSVVYFDDDEGSDTYTKHVWRCPGCNDRLDGHAFEKRTAWRESNEPSIGTPLSGELGAYPRRFGLPLFTKLPLRLQGMYSC